MNPTWPISVASWHFADGVITKKSTKLSPTFKDTTCLQTCWDVGAGLKPFTELTCKAFRRPFPLYNWHQSPEFLLDSFPLCLYLDTAPGVFVFHSSEEAEPDLSSEAGQHQGWCRGQLWASGFSAESGEEGEPSPSLFMGETRLEVSHPFASHGTSWTTGECSYHQQSAEISFVPYLTQEKRGIPYQLPTHLHRAGWRTTKRTTKSRRSF